MPAGRPMTHKTCSVCSATLVGERTWRRLSAEERVGKARHAARGLCELDYRRQRNGALPREQAIKARIITEVVDCAGDCGSKVATRVYLREHPELVRQGVRRRCAKGRCYSCYGKQIRRAGTRTREAASHEILLEEWEFLRDGGTSFAEAARRLGVAEKTLTEHLRQARAVGDRRGGLQAYGNDVRSVA